MSDEIVEIEGEVIEIHPDAKYVLMVPEDSNIDRGLIGENLMRWWDGDLPIIIVSGMRLVRVDEIEGSS